MATKLSEEARQLNVQGQTVAMLELAGETTAALRMYIGQLAEELDVEDPAGVKFVRTHKLAATIDHLQERLAADIRSLCDELDALQKLTVEVPF